MPSGKVKKKNVAGLMLEGINKGVAVKRMATGMSNYAKRLKRRVR